jgi:hypothetical protein
MKFSFYHPAANIRSAVHLAYFQAVLGVISCVVIFFTNFRPILRVHYNMKISLVIMSIFAFTGCAFLLDKKKSRIAGTLLFGWSIINTFKLLLLIWCAWGWSLRLIFSALFSLFFAFVYWKGVEGAFTYHREKKLMTHAESTDK